MDIETVRDTAFQERDDLYNSKTQAVPVPQQEIGIDTDNTLIQNVVDSVEIGQMDISAIDSFTNVSRSRNTIYDTLDAMADDPTIAAILETYAEDATETNDKGNIVWCESADGNAAKYVTYLLNTLNVDKHVYSWTHSLCKYGDVYLRLYRESEYDNPLFPKEDTRKQNLNEDVVIKAYKNNDKYVHYLEMAANPAQVFELTRFGKTAGYIKTDEKATTQLNNTSLDANSFLHRYSFQKSDVELFPATEWVHGCLEDSSSRTPEEVELFMNEAGESYTYKVKRGQSLLYNTYKVWRQLMLLENSVLLNRVTQSSIVRVIGVEVGDMPKDNVQAHLMQIKQLIEQKAALNVGKSMSEYTNPGPIINNVYIPTRNNQGVITTTQIGGDVKIGDLADLSYYQDKFFGSMRVPKQYFGVTDDNAGFSGGESLSIISSRYAKMIKRIQNTIIQMLTDAINLILIDTGNTSYINKFVLKMLPPTTKEETDRRDNLSNKVGLVRDIMDVLSDVESATTKLKILKSLLSSTITDTEVINLLQVEIETLEAQAAAESEDEVIDTSSDSTNDTEIDIFSGDEPLDLDSDSSDIVISTSDSDEGDDSLPSPADLDVGDMSDSTNPELG